VHPKWRKAIRSSGRGEAASKKSFEFFVFSFQKKAYSASAAKTVIRDDLFGTSEGMPFPKIQIPRFVRESSRAHSLGMTIINLQREQWRNTYS
jgi:hypothetical protein